MKTLWLAILLLLPACGDDTTDANSKPCYDVTGDRNRDGKLTPEDCKELNNPKQPTPGSENKSPTDTTGDGSESGDDDLSLAQAIPMG